VAVLANHVQMGLICTRALCNDITFGLPDETFVFGVSKLEITLVVRHCEAHWALRIQDRAGSM
jgi:hypothetical protein